MSRLSAGLQCEYLLGLLIPLALPFGNCLHTIQNLWITLLTPLGTWSTHGSGVNF